MRSRALVLEEPRRLELRELPVPELGDDDGLLRIEACGLCGTDHEQFTGMLWGGFGFVPGHEIVGIVEAVGAGAATRWGVRAGDRVAVEVFQSCRACDRCARGDYRRCKRHGLADMYGFTPVARTPGLWGGYADYLYLAPDAMLVPVPADLEPVTATLFNPVGAGIRWGVSLPGTKSGDVVAVLGPGIRGLATVAAVREAGARFVMVTGAGARDAGRLECAEAFGADLVVDVTVDDPVVALRDAAGTLADVVVDVTAKAPTALAHAVDLARPGATVVLAGVRGEGAVPGFRPDQIVLKELRVLGALGVDVAESEAALELVASGTYPFDSLPREVVGLDDAAELLATMAGEVDRVAPVHGVVQP